jgi:hypothetical protein
MKKISQASTHSRKVLQVLYNLLRALVDDGAMSFPPLT